MGDTGLEHPSSSREKRGPAADCADFVATPSSQPASCADPPAADGPTVDLERARLSDRLHAAWPTMNEADKAAVATAVDEASGGRS